MANKTLNVRIKSKFDTEANWLASDVILMQGELAIVVDKKDSPTSIMAKVGDGSTAFKNLPYLSHPVSELKAEIEEAVDLAFEKNFQDGLFLQCGGADPSVKLPEFISDEIINSAVDEALAKILNTEY